MAKSTKRKIIALPNPHLRERSRKVGLITKEILDIIKDMKTATLNWEDNRDYEVGVALSAIQLDAPYKIVIVRDDPEAKNNQEFTVFINPAITKREGKILEDFEGCLSVKDVYGKVPRYEKVRVRALDVNGKPFRVTASGFLARVLQHEIDHINGVLFIDHIKDRSDAFYCLDKDGQLKELNYENKVKNSRILW